MRRARGAGVALVTAYGSRTRFAFGLRELIGLLIDSSRTKAFQELHFFMSRTRRYLAGHELNPNRGVKHR